MGWELQRTCLTLGEVVVVDYPEFDLALTGEIRKLIRTVKPTIIINAAAYTDVDKAESEPDLAHKVNAIAPSVMAEEAKKLNAAFIHYSTDFVFDGANIFIHPVARIIRTTMNQSICHKRDSIC